MRLTHGILPEALRVSRICNAAPVAAAAAGGAAGRRPTRGSALGHWTA